MFEPDTTDDYIVAHMGRCFCFSKLQHVMYILVVFVGCGKVCSVKRFSLKTINC